jgi:CRISPR-associated protein Cmr6
MTIIAPNGRNLQAIMGVSEDLDVLAGIDNPILQLYLLLPDISSRGGRGEDEDKKVKGDIYRTIARGSLDAATAAATRSGFRSPDAGKLLQEFAERRHKLLERLPGEHVGPFKMRLTSDLTCGMSQPTVLENGLMLLRPYGIPMLPAPAIKGTLACWAAEIVEGELNLKTVEEEKALEEAGLLPLFGFGDRGEDREGQPGTVIFMDALPSEVHFEVDVTTVHYPGWYRRKDPPSGMENPNPVYFLTVGSGSVFGFSFVIAAGTTLSPKLTTYWKQFAEFGVKELDHPGAFLKELLLSTARYKGFGSQTARGYGRMELV